LLEYEIYTVRTITSRAKPIKFKMILALSTTIEKPAEHYKLKQQYFFATAEIM